MLREDERQTDLPDSNARRGSSPSRTKTYLCVPATASEDLPSIRTRSVWRKRVFSANPFSSSTSSAALAHQFLASPQVVAIKPIIVSRPERDVDVRATIPKGIGELRLSVDVDGERKIDGLVGVTGLAGPFEVVVGGCDERQWEDRRVDGCCWEEGETVVGREPGGGRGGKLRVELGAGAALIKKMPAASAK